MVVKECCCLCLYLKVSCNVGMKTPCTVDPHDTKKSESVNGLGRGFTEDGRALG